MLEFVTDLLLNPDGQERDAYGWVTVLFAHAVLGAGFAFVALICRAWQGWPVLAYAAFEGWHLLIGGTLTDGLTDLAAVVAGQAGAWAGWHGRRRLMAASAAILALVAVVGLFRRFNRKD